MQMYKTEPGMYRKQIHGQNGFFTPHGLAKWNSFLPFEMNGLEDHAWRNFLHSESDVNKCQIALEYI